MLQTSNHIKKIVRGWGTAQKTSWTKLYEHRVQNKIMGRLGNGTDVNISLKYPCYSTSLK